MTINNCWKLFSYLIQIYHYGKSIGIRKLSEWLALDCFNNTFKTGTRTLEKNLPLIDEIDDGESVSTLNSLCFSIYASCSTQVRNIHDPTFNTDSLSAYTLVDYNFCSQHTAE